MLPETVHTDVKSFVTRLEDEPFEADLLQSYRLSNEEIVNSLCKIFGV